MQKIIACLHMGQNADIKIQSGLFIRHVLEETQIFAELNILLHL